MNSTHRLWRWLGLIFVLSFGALGYLGWQIYLTAPPIPKSVVTTDGERAVHRRADPARPAGLDGRRRPAARHRLGPRQLRRARLVGRLAAPRSDRAAGHAQRRAAQGDADPDASRPGRRRRPRPRRDAPQHLRRVDRHREGLGRARARRSARSPATTTACSAREPVARQAARPVRDDRRGTAREGRPPGADRVLLLDLLGRRDESPGRDRSLLHQQLAARAAGRQHDVDVGRDVVDGQHHPAAGRHRRDAVAAGRAASTRKRRRCRRRTRCSAPRPRPR